MDILNILCMSLIPEAGIREGMSAGMALGLSQWSAFGLSVLGGFIPAFPLLMILGEVNRRIAARSVNHKSNGFCRTAIEENGLVLKYKEFLLLVAVIIPIPFAGAWIGSFVSSVLGIPAKRGMAIIFLGLVLSGLIALILYDPQVFG
ncbi:MAG: small multi-drug export protein [Anaerovoracaceae bacterium]